jgi:UDP-N-acetylglucosamine 4-epimerase
MRDRLAIKQPRFAKMEPHHEPFRPGDVRFSCANIDTARRMLSYSPTHTVSQGLAEALEWYLEHSEKSRRALGSAKGDRSKVVAANVSPSTSLSLTLPAP